MLEIIGGVEGNNCTFEFILVGNSHILGIDHFEMMVKCRCDYSVALVEHLDIGDVLLVGFHVAKDFI